MTEISVIIPSYNRAGLLPRTLDSVLAQTSHPMEILVVDDGSTDDTASKLAENYPEVTLLRQPNRGVSAARNLGIRYSRGNWVAFLDSDDEWLPRKLQRQIEHIQTNPVCHLVHSDEIWVRRGKRVNPRNKHRKRGGEIFRDCLPLCCISPSSVLIHKNVFHRVGLFDECLPACEDYDLWLRICAQYPVDYIEEPLIVKYGGHQDQLSRKYPAMDRFRIRSLTRIMDSGVLGCDDHIAARKILMKKLTILYKGAVKRGNDELIHECLALMQRYGEDANLSQKKIPQATCRNH